jgi:hypothetical protein
MTFLAFFMGSTSEMPLAVSHIFILATTVLYSAASDGSVQSSDATLVAAILASDIVAKKVTVTNATSLSAVAGGKVARWYENQYWWRVQPGARDGRTGPSSSFCASVFVFTPKHKQDIGVLVYNTCRKWRMRTTVNYRVV